LKAASSSSSSRHSDVSHLSKEKFHKRPFGGKSYPKGGGKKGNGKGKKGEGCSRSTDALRLSEQNSRWQKALLWV
jgi:hypothetical protein